MPCHTQEWPKLSGTHLNSLSLSLSHKFILSKQTITYSKASEFLPLKLTQWYPLLVSLRQPDYLVTVDQRAGRTGVAVRESDALAHGSASEWVKPYFYLRESEISHHKWHLFPSNKPISGWNNRAPVTILFKISTIAPNRPIYSIY